LVLQKPQPVEPQVLPSIPEVKKETTKKDDDKPVEEKKVPGASSSSDILP